MVLQQTFSPDWAACLTENIHHKHKIHLEMSTLWHGLTQMKNSYNSWKKKKELFGDQNKKVRLAQLLSLPPAKDGDPGRPEGPHGSQGPQKTRGSWAQSQAPQGPIGLRHWWHRVPSAWEGCSAKAAWQHLSSWFKGSLPSERRTGRKPGRLLVLWTIETDWHFPIKFPVNRQSHKLWFKRKTKIFREK